MKPVNLIPRERRTRASGAHSGSAYVLVGFLALLLAMVTAYILTSNQIKEGNADAAAASAEADRFEAQAQSLGAFSAFTQVKQTRLASVSQVARSRFDWERTMRELARVIPSGSWLQTVDASVTGTTGDASTTSQDGSGGSPAAQLVGCTPKQSDVARLMVRLRQMYKVTDVSLTGSTQQDGEGKGSIVDCGGSYQFDVRVTFGATPQDETPRGAQKVPATLGGGS